MLDPAIVMASTTPLTNGGCGIGLYTTGHPVRLVAIICVAMTYHMVVNHSTMLNITSLKVLHTLLIPITGTTSPPTLNTSLPPKVHTNPG
jgi:hypothetical protein